jgi:formate hydrogenlyase subunit 5
VDDVSVITGPGIGSFAEQCRTIWHDRVTALEEPGSHRLHCLAGDLVPLCEWLNDRCDCIYAALVVEAADETWYLRHIFYASHGKEWVTVEVTLPSCDTSIPSIAAAVPAADWHEREVADLFGLTFTGHLRLAPFVLHEGWPAPVPLMRTQRDMRGSFVPGPAARQDADIQHLSDEPGAFAMPIGPVFSDHAESAQFRIDSFGEDVNHLDLKLFYKFRAVEKLAEGQRFDSGLLLAERFSGSAAFAHGLAFCQAVEAICGVAPPPRALALRALLAELERLRSHVATITGICNSTALAVATSLSAILEEELLRLSCIASGHRYFFGATMPGGLRADLSAAQCRELRAHLGGIIRRLNRLERMLRQASSFLDRLEEVGVVSPDAAALLGLVGPVARASGIRRDLRDLFPYAAYADHAPTIPMETIGDGYARLRVFFHEANEAAALIDAIAADLPDGPVNVGPIRTRAGAALGAVEAPLGAAFHYLRLAEDGTIQRLRITPPSFANWRGFQAAAESFAFQDFPIILATFGLSNAENDR